MRRAFLDNKGRGLIETVFFIMLALVIAGIFAGEWLVHLKEAREVALENQLTNMKLSLELYMIVEGQYPEDLGELDKRCTAFREDSLYGKKYLELQAHDKEGYPVDPYGRRFIYDNKSGTIGRGRD